MAFEQKPSTAPAITKDFGIAPACQCGRASQIATATCVNKSTGQIKTGTASEFCGRDNHNNPNWILQDWWEIRRFEGWCAECFAGEKPPHKRKYSDDLVRDSWRWMMGEISHDAEGEISKVFKRVRLTDDQRDKAIEVVNDEAFRCNEPDSVPDRFKISGVWS